MSPNASNKDVKAATPTGEANKKADPAEGEHIHVKDRRHAASGQSQVGEEASADGDGQVNDEAAGAGEAEALAAKLAQSEARLSATLAQYKDALDEFADAKARIRRDVSKEIDAGKRTILVALLDVVDNLERAIEAAKAAGEADDSFFEGVCMVRDQFLQKLEQLGVTRRSAAGELFDPDHFEAISTVPVPTPEQDGIVVGVVRDCYLLGNETLRHGMVAVGKHTKASS